MLKTRTER